MLRIYGGLYNYSKYDMTCWGKLFNSSRVCTLQFEVLNMSHGKVNRIISLISSFRIILLSFWVLQFLKIVRKDFVHLLLIVFIFSKDVLCLFGGLAALLALFCTFGPITTWAVWCILAYSRSRRSHSNRVWGPTTDSASTRGVYLSKKCGIHIMNWLMIVWAVNTALKWYKNVAI